ncbi:MAG TPA: ATP phosphoribosyltransferase regulatory subunit [Gammaproteobacteria bacterium]|nr:ATP phosphoribosyltransferase regulatory subunit [Gammaproteobacteria bacterium]
MNKSERWLLPEGIDELLPEQAEQIEFLRRSILKLFQRWGYRFVMTPMVEHLDSLLVGMGNDLNHRTFKLTDEMTGRLLGVRADITPQVSRIDAHRFHNEGPSRLCYAGPVLLTRPRELGGSRNPIQIGAELYGHQGIESDIEVLELMLGALQRSGLDVSSLDLGHVGIFRELVKQFGIDPSLESRLFDALQRKAKTDIQDLLAEQSPACQATFVALIELNGGCEVFAEAKSRLPNVNPQVSAALQELENIYLGLRKRCPNISMHFDLAELRGYQYHTGVVFAAYVPGYWQAIAQGGRYDEVGKVFGRARPATGFSMDLRAVCQLLSPYESATNNIYAPALDDAELENEIHRLREAGETVLRELPGQRGAAIENGCDRVLVKRDNQWRIEAIPDK